jgi:cytochrome P450
MPVFAIENDPDLVPDPEKFDGLRYYRLATGMEMNGFVPSKGGLTGSTDDYRFSTPSPTSLSFGYGRAACPGRFFASLVIKMIMVKLLSEYEFRFVPKQDRYGNECPGQRPTNYMFHEFLFPWPWDWMQVKRRQGGNCPF